MSRIRTVKPEYWSSEQIMNLSIPARLLFIGMWNFCDDRGIHPANPKTLKAQIFPSDDIDAAPLVQELLNQGLIAAYSANDKEYFVVTGWNHQKIDKPTFKHPAPPKYSPPTQETDTSICKPVGRGPNLKKETEAERIAREKEWDEIEAKYLAEEAEEKRRAGQMDRGLFE